MEIRCTFLKIHDVDTKKQQFEAELLISAKWHEPKLKELMAEQVTYVLEDTFTWVSETSEMRLYVFSCISRN